MNIFYHCRFGIFWAKNEATIFLRDLDLIKKVQITDSDHFTDLGFFAANIEFNEFGLADLKGEAWRKMKRQLTPSFSIPRLKKNVTTMNEIGNKVKEIKY